LIKSLGIQPEAVCRTELRRSVFSCTVPPGDVHAEQRPSGEALQALEKAERKENSAFTEWRPKCRKDAPFCLVSRLPVFPLYAGFGLIDLDALDQGTLAPPVRGGSPSSARGCFGGGLLKDSLDEVQLKAATPKWHVS